LGSGPWTVSGARALVHSRSLKSLRALHLVQGNERSRGVARVVLGSPRVRRLHDLGLEVSGVGKAALQALAGHSRPLRLRRLKVRITPGMVGTWELLVGRGMLPRLTELALVGPARGALRAVLAAGRLPDLRRLDLYGVADLDEFQALLDSPLLRQLQAL